MRNGAPGEIRTPDLLVRSQTLYPAELRAHRLLPPRNSREAKRAHFITRAARSKTSSLISNVGASAPKLCIGHIIPLHAHNLDAESFKLPAGGRVISCGEIHLSPVNETGSDGLIPGRPGSERIMANTFGKDILIQAKDPMKAANFYVKELGFEITDKNPNMIGLHGANINLFIEPGPALGTVLEVTVKNVKEAKARLKKKGCRVIKDESDFPRCYIKDPNGLIYNLTE